jgi:chorismate mutase
MLKAIRGAATVRSNTANDIVAATQDMLKEIVALNNLSPTQIVSALFTLTPDLNAAFPASAARALGWTDVPMICAQEIPVPGALPMVVRVLIHADVTGQVYHVYQGGALALRPDWSAKTKAADGHDAQSRDHQEGG